MPPTLFLLFFLVSPALSATRFIISGSISCSSPFQYNMRVIEIDAPFKNDVLYKDHLQSPPSSPVFFNISLSDSHDGVSNMYELAIDVLHNCNSLVYTKNSVMRYFLGYFPITHGTYYVKYDMNVTDMGGPYVWPLDVWSPALDRV